MCPPTLGALELHDDKVRVLVEREQIDPPTAVVPIAELLGEHHRVGTDDGDVRAEQALKIGSFADVLQPKCRGSHCDDRVLLELVQGHIASYRSFTRGAVAGTRSRSIRRRQESYRSTRSTRRRHAHSESCVR